MQVFSLWRVLIGKELGEMVKVNVKIQMFTLTQNMVVLLMHVTVEKVSGFPNSRVSQGSGAGLEVRGVHFFVTI